MVEVAIDSDAARLNGLVYLAAGRGVHPLVIFLDANAESSEITGGASAPPL